MNMHAEWRLAVAGRVAAACAGNPKVAALTVAGSVGAGLADQFSDLEIDCYWTSPPTDADRLAPVQALGAELSDLWDYDDDDEEWSDDYRVGPLDVTVSNFVTASIGRFLDDVILRFSTEPVRHMRLAALQRSRPLTGAGLVASWRSRADEFPAQLVTALVEQALAPAALRGWAAREALVSRGDTLAVSDLLARAGQAAVGAVLALNRVYQPHRQLKWQASLVTGLGIAPDRFAERLAALSAGDLAAAVTTTEALLGEVADLAESHGTAAIGEFRAELGERRRVVLPPSAPPAR
jgi:hypothetical protein